MEGKKLFDKRATTIDQQLEQLKQRGMVIVDEDKAKRYLRHIGYYHLRAYWLPFEIKKPTIDDDHQFCPNTKFEDVVALYVFDRKLRLLVFEAIERVEIALRAKWANCMALKYGPHGYLEKRHYNHKRDEELKRLLLKLENDVEHSGEKFIKHYDYTYSKPELPPIWMAAELLSFGKLIKWIDLLKDPKDKQEVGSLFNFYNIGFFISFLNHLNYIRNICAHHNRLWNRIFGERIRSRTAPLALKNMLNEQKNGYLYNTLMVLSYCMDKINPNSSWKKRVIKLIKCTPLAEPAKMGFPENWREYEIWK